jgi:hypothetical protein
MRCDGVGMRSARLNLLMVFVADVFCFSRQGDLRG